MSIVAWIALGVAAGAVVGWLTGGRGRDLVASVVVGLMGALLGGFLASVLLGLDSTDVDPTSVIAAGIGALALIVLLRGLPAIEVFD